MIDLFNHGLFCTHALSLLWNESNLLKGCQRVIEMLDEEGQLATEWSIDNATDALWTMLLVPNWENLTIKCGWSTAQYVDWMTMMARRAFVVDSV